MRHHQGHTPAVAVLDVWNRSGKAFVVSSVGLSIAITGSGPLHLSPKLEEPKPDQLPEPRNLIFTILPVAENGLRLWEAKPRRHFLAICQEEMWVPGLEFIGFRAKV